MKTGKVLGEIQALTANLYKLYGSFHCTKAISLALEDTKHSWSLKNYTLTVELTETKMLQNF